jgi:hypothetical protein
MLMNIVKQQQQQQQQQQRETERSRHVLTSSVWPKTGMHTAAVGVLPPSRISPSNYATSGPLGKPQQPSEC